jgi:hypothetical protein
VARVVSATTGLGTLEISLRRGEVEAVQEVVSIEHLPAGAKAVMLIGTRMLGLRHLGVPWYTNVSHGLVTNFSLVSCSKGSRDAGCRLLPMPGQRQRLTNWASALRHSAHDLAVPPTGTWHWHLVQIG